MPTYSFGAARQINAPAERLYELIADYRRGHPRILPRPPFVDLHVEQGGYGDGTIVSFQMRLLGRLQHFRAAISEPEPGRVLLETDLARGVVTAFSVAPRAPGAAVSITTTLPVRSGPVGRIEGWLAEQMLRPVYVRELAQLEAMVAGESAG